MVPPGRMPQLVWTISTSVLALRQTLAGTDPSSRPPLVLSPTEPTISRSALTGCTRRGSQSPDPAGLVLPSLPSPH
jgi:hypothetical protein